MCAVVGNIYIGGFWLYLASGFFQYWWWWHRDAAFRHKIGHLAAVFATLSYAALWPLCLSVEIYRMVRNGR